jgi:hypothetical protein
MPTVGGATGETLTVHIGIASGEVVASGLGANRHRAYTVIGNSVNLAARLLNLAGTGETVLDEAVHAAVHRLARCTPIADAKIKGIDVPLTAWRFVEFVDMTERHARSRSSAAPRSWPSSAPRSRVARPAEAAARCSFAATPGSASRGSSVNCGAAPSLPGFRATRAHPRFRHGQGTRGGARDRVEPHEAAAGSRRRHPARRASCALARHRDLVKDEPFLRDILASGQEEGATRCTRPWTTPRASKEERRPSSACWRSPAANLRCCSSSRTCTGRTR